MKKWTVGAILAALVLVSACDPVDQEPKRQLGAYKVEKKRKPCGNDGVCASGEVGCWQFQLHNQTTGKTEFRCVTQKEWNEYAIGAVYP